jgi:hypothetical protein
MANFGYNRKEEAQREVDSKLLYPLYHNLVRGLAKKVL